MSPSIAPAHATPPTDRSVQGPCIRAGDSEIHGRGVYALRTIPDGARVVEYRGERITKAESRRREIQRLARQRRGGDGCVTIFDLNQRFDLDGRGRHNVARLINHSCAPNCRAETIRGKIWIIARRDIGAGEELTFDYGYAFEEWPLHPCRCGARNCAGFIVNSGQRWRVRRLQRSGRLLSTTRASSATPRISEKREKAS